MRCCTKPSSQIRILCKRRDRTDPRLDVIGRNQQRRPLVLEHFRKTGRSEQTMGLPAAIYSKILSGDIQSEESARPWLPTLYW